MEPFCYTFCLTNTGSSLYRVDIHNEVCIEQWSEKYLLAFEQEKKCIETAAGKRKLKAVVFHVGGTSVKDMPGKEIVDILVCPDAAFVPEDLIPALESIGYRNLGECGRPGRYFLTKGYKPLETFYLHLCSKDHPVAKDQLLFKKILEENEALRHKYAYLKHLLEYAYPQDRNMYRELKGMFVEGVLGGYRHANDQNK